MVRAGAVALRAEVEGGGLIQPGCRTASGESHSSLTLPTWRVTEELSLAPHNSAQQENERQKS